MTARWTASISVTALALTAASGAADAERDGRARRGRKKEGHADHDRAAARLVRLRRADRRLQGEVRPRGQRAQSRRRLRRRDRGDQGQQGQQRPAGAGRDRRRPLLRPVGQGDGLLQPYKVSTWDTIPDSAKDADGYWYGDYYGVLAFEVNTDIVKNVAAGLGRPAEAGVQERGRAGRRSAHLEPGDPGRLCRRARDGGRRRGAGRRGRA